MITMLAIGMGLMLAIFLRGLLSGLDKQIIDGFIKLQSGHFQIHAKGYSDKARLLPLDISIEEPKKIIDEIIDIPEIDGIASRIRFGGLVSSGINSFGVLGIGIQPSAEEKVSILLQKVSEGNKLGDKDGYALIGKKLAEDLNLKVGSMLIIVANTIYGAMNAIELEVKGIIDSGSPQYDASVVFMTIKDAQRLLDMENRITDLVISIKETKKTDTVLASIARKLGIASIAGKLSNYEVEIQSWKEMGESLWRTGRLRDRFFTIVYLVVILVAVMGVINTMLMSVTERTREIGTIMAIGTTQKEVLTLFLLEGLVLGIMGGLLGSFSGGLLVQYFATFGISLKGTTALSQTAVGEAIYAQFSWSQIVISFIVAQIIAVLSASYPAYIASKQEPVEALRHI
jgi:putative ABC transport system permease protein